MKPETTTDQQGFPELIQRFFPESGGICFLVAVVFLTLFSCNTYSVIGRYNCSYEYLTFKSDSTFSFDIWTDWRSLHSKGWWTIKNDSIFLNSFFNILALPITVRESHSYSDKYEYSIENKSLNVGKENNLTFELVINDTIIRPFNMNPMKIVISIPPKTVIIRCFSNLKGTNSIEQNKFLTTEKYFIKDNTCTQFNITYAIGLEYLNYLTLENSLLIRKRSSLIWKERNGKFTKLK